MNRRNFLKNSLYAGITIITSKGIVFPEKKIIEGPTLLVFDCATDTWNSITWVDSVNSPYITTGGLNVPLENPCRTIEQANELAEKLSIDHTKVKLV